MLVNIVGVCPSQTVAEGRHGTATFLYYLTQVIAGAFGSLQISHGGHTRLGSGVAPPTAIRTVAVGAVDGKEFCTGARGSRLVAEGDNACRVGGASAQGLCRGIEDKAGRLSCVVKPDAPYRGQCQNTRGYVEEGFHARR